MAEEVSHFGNNGKTDNRNRDSAMLVCTLSGRIIYATGELKAMFGTDLSGRNLNDFLDDKTVAGIISKSVAGEYYFFNSLISGKSFSGVSEKEGDSVTITFTEKTEGDRLTISENSLRYLQSEINSILSTLLGALKSFGKDDNPTTMFAKKNVYRLIRVTRNVFDKALCEGACDIGTKNNYDILEICRNIIEKIRFPLKAVNVEIELWHDGGEHICNCVPEQIERMITNIISCVLKDPVKNGKALIIKIEVAEKDNEVLISVLGPCRVVTEGVMTNIFGSTGTASAFDTELKQSLSTVKTLAAYNGGSFVMAAEKDGDRLAVALPKEKNARGTVLRTTSSAYISGTNNALVELAEILPDSLY